MTEQETAHPDAWLDHEIIQQIDLALDGKVGPAHEEVTVTRGILQQARDRIVRDEPRNGR